MHLIALVTLLVGAAPDTAVVCAPEFRAALAPWIALREGQGRRIALLPAPADASALRESIRRLAAAGSLRFVLLVGDADGPAGFNAEARVSATAGPHAPLSKSAGAAARGKPLVPTRHVPAEVNVRFGSERHIATDSWFADLDDDGAPDLAIGRLTADTPDELAAMVAKIVAYETSRDFGLWRREVHFVAGVGGFGPLVDTAVELAAKSVITAGLPSTHHTVMTQASWTSAYFPDPRAFRQQALAGLEDGCLFWVYMGHGRRTALDDAPAFAGRSAPILDRAAARRLTSPPAPAIACLFACYSGAFDGVDDCLAEELLRARGGPVAVLCASRVTMPYGMSTLGMELLAETFVERRATLGEAVLAAKRALVDPKPTKPMRQTLDTMAKWLSPAPVDLAGERAEHLAMFNLLGDPLLSLKHPRPLAIEAPRRATAGEEILIEGTSPLAGVGVVEIVARRDRLRFDPAPRTGSPVSDAEAERCGEAYRAANDPAWVRQAVRLAAGRFSFKLALPADATGPCHARIYLAGLDDCAAGAADLEIDPAKDR